MFNSQKINNDPWPYVWSGHSPIDKARTNTDMFRKGSNSRMTIFGYEHNPRPEYDNNPNPILENYRKVGQSPDSWLYMVLSDLVNPEDPLSSGHTVEHLNHARKVLERLVNVYGSH